MNDFVDRHDILCEKSGFKYSDYYFSEICMRFSPQNVVACSVLFFSFSVASLKNLLINANKNI